MYEPHAIHEVQHGISVLPLYDTSDLSVLHFMHGMRFLIGKKSVRRLIFFRTDFYNSFMKKSSAG